jgi:ABC-type nitrate/sulfonate/bicarbonate transport system substrate-binding protein
MKKTFLLLIGLWWITDNGLVEAQGLARLYVGVPTVTMSWFPVHVAVKKGFFKEQGIAMDPVVILPRVAVNALAAGDIPYITPVGTIISAAARGLPIRLIMVLATSTHVLVTKPEITAPSQLRGRTVVINQPGDTTNQILNTLLKKYGIDAKDVKILPIPGGNANRSMALRLGQADAVLITIPYDLVMEKEGFRSLVYFKDIMDLPATGIATHDERIRKRPQEVTGVLTAILKGVMYTKSHKDEMLPLIKEFVGLESLDMARKAYDTYMTIWPDTGMGSEEGLRMVMNLAGIAATVPVEKMVNWSPLREASAALKHAR